MQYKIEQGYLQKLGRRSILKSAPVLLLVLGGGFAMVFCNNKEGVTLNVKLFTIAIMLASITGGLYRGTKRKRALLESLTITTGSNMLTREQYNTPTISLYYSEIQSITRQKNGTLTVSGKESGDTIIIPAYMAHYSELEQELQGIHPIMPFVAVTLLQKYPLLFLAVPLVCMICLFATTNKIVAAICGPVTVSALILSYIQTRNNKSIDNKTKRQMRWVWLVLIATTVRTIAIFMGQAV